MPFKKDLNLKDCFFIKDNQIILTDNYKKTYGSRFKKITGSRFPTVLGVNAYSSPFMEWLKMVNLYSESMDPTLANAGVQIEPKVRDFVIEKFKVNYKAYEPNRVGYDIFKENPIFGGIPDGEPVDENGQIIYDQNHPMLEIKTSSIDKLVYKTVNDELRMMLDNDGMPIVKQKRAKYEEWYDENQKPVVKKEYVMQLSLYLYLRKAKYGRFGIIFLRPEDYKYPEKLDINKRVVEIVDMQIDPADVKPYIDQAEKWYNDHIKTGISPKFGHADLEFLRKNRII
ncbi:MPN551 family DNA-binding protein [Mycoplasma sp. E35C]|uniref:MPN551 family DNA-binding protein n=1 Tax=Mycoplasma sp. E35C TaxID=2801918 RepID=UPI00210394D3|nr:YqaJ viral recombinase family protein [Mycoplasma sp. E35C]